MNATEDDSDSESRIGKYFRFKLETARALAQEAERTGRTEIRIVERALEVFFAQKPSEREVWNQRASAARPKQELHA